MINKLQEILSKIGELVPVKIRTISLSLTLFMLWWWLWTDTYFSIYVKEVVGSARWVTIIWALLAAVKLFFTIPIWRMNDHVNMKYILLIWKVLYAVAWLLFFLAGISHSWILIIFASLFNWVANSTTFTTYRSYYAKNSTKSDNAQLSWIYFSAMYFTEVVWSLIAAVLVNYLELPYMYLFVVIFSLVSLLHDEKIKTVLSRHYNKTRKNFYSRIKKESEQDIKIEETSEFSQPFFGEKWFLRSFVKECTSLDSWKEIWQILHKYNWKMYVALWSFMLTNFLNYTSYLFIPIVAAENNLSLSQIAIVFAAMKLPYVVNIFTWKFWDRYSKKLIISIILVLMSFLYVVLWFHEWFYTILILTFFISLWVALLNPLTAALVISYTDSKDNGAMIWVQDFVWRAGDIVWSLWFWTLTAIIWLQKWFIVVWLCTFWLWIYLAAKKLISYKSKNNEREKVKSNEVYQLPVPVVDAIHSEAINKK